MDKRTLIAIVLIFVVFWLSNELIWKRKAPPPPRPTETVERVRETEPVASQTKETAETIPASIAEKLLPVSDIPINDNIALSNDKITILFSNLGGTAKKVLLTDYFLTDQVQPVNLVPNDGSLTEIILQTEAGNLDLSKRVYRWERRDADGYPSLVFYLGEDSGRTVEKQYFLVDDYRLVMKFSARGLGELDGYVLSLGSGIADTEEALRHKDNDYKLITQIQGSQKSYTLRQLNRSAGGDQIAGNVNWAAIRSKYFLMALIPDEQLQTSYLRAKSVSYLEDSETKHTPSFYVAVKQGRQATFINDTYQLYLGPLLYRNLEQFNNGLEETMELGWKFIRPLGRLFLWVLTSVNKAIPNYGITIMIFAFLLKIVLYPLTHKSFQSMQKMQKMQPYMQEIQKKYKSDPKKMQAELGKLYKEHGTNPAGGCLPLLLQMPVFFALYPVLRYAIDLRQASFMLWITDLSEPDPLMILPIAMGLFMFIQQKLSTPQNVDKANMDEKQLAAMQSQKMMMYVMPVFMVFIFRGLPSGLVLYWTVFNVFSIVQQYLIKKKLAN